MKLRIATAVVASIAMLAGIPALAQDGATLFKTKCAMCHGDQGQGKPAMGAPKLVGTTKNRSEERRVGKECRSRWSPYH